MTDDFERITLRNGPLTFSALAAGTGPVVLCLHGFPDHARSMRHQLRAFAEAGYRAVAPAMRGYEPHSQPADGDYSNDARVEDVAAWLDGLEVERCHLFGHDWGAVTAYAAAAEIPHRFASAVTVAVPHMERFTREAARKLPSQVRNSWYFFFFQLRGIAEFWVRRNDWALIRKLWRDWSPGYELPETEWRALVRTMEQPGVCRAMLGYYRSEMALRNIFGTRFRQIGVPTLAITGAGDGCIDTRLFDVLMHDRDFPAGLEVRRIDGAGHFVHLEAPEKVNKLALDWFARRRSRIEEERASA